MTYALAAHVHAVTIGDDVVLLDVAGDAYFCAPDGRRLLRLDDEGRVISPIAPDLAAPLLAAGLVAAGARVPVAALKARPLRALGSCESDRVSPRDLWRLCGALFDYAVRYRWRSFSDILRFAARRGGDGGCSLREVERVSRVFQRAVIWLPIPGQCLVRSFVLLRFLQRSGCRATWVFGVQTWPFAAHCWLQHEGLALDDTPERLALYEPILAIRP